MTVGLTGMGTYVPDRTITGEEIAERAGIPAEVVVEKMGLARKHVCPPEDDHVTDMGVAAARDALADAGVDAGDLDLVLYHGSEYKDHVVWSAAADIAERLGAGNAYANELYALCAGAPVAVRSARAQLATGDVDRALLVTASREEDLIDYGDADSSFMFNFGSGAAAAVLERDPGDRSRALVFESAATTDGSFADDVVMPAGGSRRPPTHDTVDAGLHHLTVPDPDGMKERLAEVTLANFRTVADRALERSGFAREDVDFLALVHMKRSFTDLLFEEFGLDPERDGYYLDDYGHVQSADQFIAVEEGLARGRIDSGDLVLFLAAGTGYTWAATALEWLE
ncbi:beta-ketoacyl-ACP synthase [Halobacteriales archaeon QS_8_69_26]|nr:MAG: beta-ketoacyl-ACP synthase [Halobacteriales archaeon QS_8_69_26]